MKKDIFYLLGKLCDYLIRGTYRMQTNYYKEKMKSCGKNVWIGAGCTFTAKTISIGNNTSIGKNCCIQSAHGQIRIGNNVMIGPNVHIHGGNHKIHEIGKLMLKASEKKPEEDGMVIINDDCWIGACAIILKGVEIGKGSVVGAGSIVTQNLPEYCIYTGSASPLLRRRFSEEEVEIHEKILAQEKKK